VQRILIADIFDLANKQKVQPLEYEAFISKIYADVNN